MPDQARSTEERTATHPPDPGKSPDKLPPPGSRGGDCGRVPPYIQPTSCHRGIDPYVGMLQGHSQPPPPSRVTIERMAVDSVDLYRHMPPPGQTILVDMTPLPVKYSVTVKDEIAWAVRRICLNRSIVPLVMRV